ncbi:hypothetical protein [Burkholderia reimsis]|uniref:hypothetical protein n=1 Tax=Burkholderia reimsis TaxID=2234132 RepID=UPI0010588B86|nr:hypothetical protein [Burkholderia reimsis]
MLIEEVAKTICDTHFIAAGWNADHAGLEQGVEATPIGLCEDRFAVTKNHTASTRCFPDLYVWRRGGAGFFIEVRSLGDTVPDEEVAVLIPNVLSQYNSVFERQHRRSICDSRETDVSADGGAGSDSSTYLRSGSDSASIRDETDLPTDGWRTPILFYVIGKSMVAGSFVFLIHPNEDEMSETAYAASSIHDGSLDGKATQDVVRLVADLRLAWRESIQPGLDCVLRRRGAFDA